MAARRATALAAALFAFGLGEELWFRYLPAYLRTLGGALWTIRPDLLGQCSFEQVVTRERT